MTVLENKFIMIFLHLLIISLATIVTLHVRRMRRITAMISQIPGPPTLLLIGNAHLFFGLNIKGVMNIQKELLKTYGPILRVWLGPHLWVNLAEPKYIGAVLSSEYGTRKDPSYQFFKSYSDGLFIASGRKWKTLRRIINPTFHHKLLESFLITFDEQSTVLVQQLEKEVDKPTFDIGEYTAKCTLDILCCTLMGVECNVQHDKHNNFASRVIIERKRRNQEKDLKNQVDGFDGKRTIYLDTIIEHFKNMTVDDLTTLTIDTFIAGSDTTRVATAYTFMLLGTHPDIQEKVHQEIVSVVGDGEFTIHTLSSLKYLEMVLKEVLRLFSVPVVARKLEKDLDIGDLILPSSTSIQISFHAIHHDPRFWKRPEEFYPDHFLPEEVAKRPKFSYLPFGYGARNCPGHAFAMLSMKTMVGSVLRKYKISSKFDLQNAEYDYLFMQEQVNGYPVQLTRR